MFEWDDEDCVAPGEPCCDDCEETEGQGAMATIVSAFDSLSATAWFLILAAAAAGYAAGKGK